MVVIQRIDSNLANFPLTQIKSSLKNALYLIVQLFYPIFKLVGIYVVLNVDFCKEHLKNSQRKAVCIEHLPP